MRGICRGAASPRPSLTTLPPLIHPLLADPSRMISQSLSVAYWSCVTAPPCRRPLSPPRPPLMAPPLPLLLAGLFSTRFQSWSVASRSCATAVRGGRAPREKRRLLLHAAGVVLRAVQVAVQVPVAR